METKVNYTIVGAFVLLLGGLLVAGILWFASGGGFQKSYDLYLAIVDESVAGLSLSAPVKYRGVDVGKVKDIRLDPENPEKVQLLFAIERGTPVKEDTEAVLKTQGLTGIAYVELSGGSRESPALRAKTAGGYPEIRTKPSLSARLENVLTTVLAKLDSTSDSVNKILSDENLAAFKSTLADLSVLAKTLAARKDTIDKGIASAATTFDNSARVTAQLNKELGPLLERVGKSADAVRKMGDETALAASSAGRAVDSIGSDVKRFSADTLPELQRLMGELNSLTVTLRRFIRETERNPRGFLFGRKPVPSGPGEEGPDERPSK
jgi:phospholipid/cholesterol/gamma-HCH transport system substrate-binding protein